MAKRRSSISGFAEAKKVLRDLPDAMEKRVLRTATREAARVVLNATKAAAPQDTEGQSPDSKKYGRLRRNLAMQVAKNLEKGEVGFVVTTRAGFWGYFLEYGTGQFYAGTGNKSKGAGARTHIRPRPWFRPAVDSVTHSANAAATDGIAKGLDREVRRLARTHGSLKPRKGK